MNGGVDRTRTLTLIMTELRQQSDVDVQQSDMVAGKRRIMWLFNCIGTPDSLLYWNGIFPPYLLKYPESEFLSARPPSKPILGTDHVVKCAGSVRIPLGRRRNSYERQFVIASPTILFAVRKFRPDVLIVSELLAYSIYVAIFRRLISSRVLVLIEGDPYQGSTRKPHWLIRRMRRFAASRVDGFLTNNDGGKEYLVGQLGVSADKVAVRPFLVSEIESGQGKREFDLPETIAQDAADPGKVAFLYVGQLVERKGVLPLVKAIGKLPEETKARMVLWLVGDGEQRQEIGDCIEQLGLQDTVKMPGRCPYEELPGYYQAADVFVMPTLDDYRALVGFEALSQGLPMLHSIYDGACRETVVAGENGLTFDPLDSQQTSESVAWFVNNRDQLAKMADASRRISKNYTVEKAVAGIAEAIESCLKDKPQE